MKRWLKAIQCAGVVLFLAGLFVGLSGGRGAGRVASVVSLWMLIVGTLAVAYTWLRASVRDDSLVYRKVVERVPNGENCTVLRLECGHVYNVFHRERESLPCAQCKEERDK